MTYRHTASERARTHSTAATAVSKSINAFFLYGARKWQMTQPQFLRRIERYINLWNIFEIQICRSCHANHMIQLAIRIDWKHYRRPDNSMSLQ